MEEVCRRCGRGFAISGNRKIDAMAMDSPFGALVVGFKELRVFNVLVCPHCGDEFTSEKVKMFGLFPRAQLWVPIAFVLGLFSLMVWYVSK